jgi:hypothetical protein
MNNVPVVIKMATLVLWMVKMMVKFFLVGCYKLEVLDPFLWALNFAKLEVD